MLGGSRQLLRRACGASALRLISEGQRLHSATAYYAVAIAALAFVTIAGLCPVAEDCPRPVWVRLTPPWAFWLSAAVALVAWSWPGIAFNRQINPDESMFLAEAHLAAVRPLPWLDFDPTTSGPLNIWPLTILHAVGFNLTYATARALAVALILMSVFALYRSMQLLFGEAAARLSSTCAICFYATAMYITEFAHYSSETVPMFLVAFLGLAIVKIAKAPAWASIGYAAVAGVLAGMIPLAKLQAAPLGAVLFGVGVAVILARDGALRWKAANVAALVLCVLAVFVAILAPVAFAGGWNDFLTSYVRQPLWWTGPLGPSLNKGPIKIGAYPPFCLLVIFVLPFSIFATALALWFPKSATVRCRIGRLAPLGAALAVTIAGAFAVAIAHEPLGHHLLLLVIPVCALAGSSFAVMVECSAYATRGREVALVLVGALVAGSVALSLELGNPFLQFETAHRWPYQAQLTAFATPSQAMLLQAIPPNSSLTVWGWAPEAYVLTGSTMGTRDVITQHEMWPGPNQRYYLERYLNDLRRYRPAYFLDAVVGRAGSSTLTVPENQLKNYALVADYVSAHYRLIRQADGLRLYRKI
jgi:hypothetical protein